MVKTDDNGEEYHEYRLARSTIIMEATIAALVVVGAMLLARNVGADIIVSVSLAMFGVIAAWASRWWSHWRLYSDRIELRRDFRTTVVGFNDASVLVERDDADHNPIIVAEYMKRIRIDKRIAKHRDLRAAIELLKLPTMLEEEYELNYRLDSVDGIVLKHSWPLRYAGPFCTLLFATLLLLLLTDIDDFQPIQLVLIVPSLAVVALGIIATVSYIPIIRISSTEISSVTPWSTVTLQRNQPLAAQWRTWLGSPYVEISNGRQPVSISESMVGAWAVFNVLDTFTEFVEQDLGEVIESKSPVVYRWVEITFVLGFLSFIGWGFLPDSSGSEDSVPMTTGGIAVAILFFGGALAYLVWSAFTTIITLRCTPTQIEIRTLARTRTYKPDKLIGLSIGSIGYSGAKSEFVNLYFPRIMYNTSTAADINGARLYKALAKMYPHAVASEKVHTIEVPRDNI